MCSYSCGIPKDAEETEIAGELLITIEGELPAFGTLKGVRTFTVPKDARWEAAFMARLHALFGAGDDLRLEVRADVTEVVAVSGHAHQQVPVLLGALPGS